MQDYRAKIVFLITELQSVPKGRIIFTCANQETGNHRTFKVCKSDFADGKIVVSLLTGADNESAYTGFGFLNLDTGKVKVWSKFSTSDTYPKYARIIEGLFTGTLPEKLSFSHSGKCFKCGRTLTTPESIESGIGPVCAEF